MAAEFFNCDTPAATVGFGPSPMIAST